MRVITRIASTCVGRAMAFVVIAVLLVVVIIYLLWSQSERKRSQIESDLRFDVRTCVSIGKSRSAVNECLQATSRYFVNPSNASTDVVVPWTSSRVGMEGSYCEIKYGSDGKVKSFRVIYAMGAM